MHWYIPHLLCLVAWKASQPPAGANQTQKLVHLCQYGEGWATGQAGSRLAFLPSECSASLASLSFSILGSQTDFTSSLVFLLPPACRTDLSVDLSIWRSSSFFRSRKWRMKHFISFGKVFILMQASSASLLFVSISWKTFCLAVSLWIFSLSAASIFQITNWDLFFGFVVDGRCDMVGRQLRTDIIFMSSMVYELKKIESESFTTYPEEATKGMQDILHHP